jgi:hypothetical protein
MKKRLKEMEEEAAALRDMQAKVEREMSAVQGSNILLTFTVLNSATNLHYNSLSRFFVLVLRWLATGLFSMSYCTKRQLLSIR